MGAQNLWNAMEVAEKHSSDIPSSLLTLDITLPLPQMKPHIINLCKDMFKKWSHLDDSRFSVETVSGGITNLLLKVTVREDNGNDCFLTVRLYGPNTEYVIDRERELQMKDKSDEVVQFMEEQCYYWLWAFLDLSVMCSVYCGRHSSLDQLRSGGIHLKDKAIGYLSAAGFGAELLGVFGNGMVQSFINARTLSPSDMRKPKLAADIGRQLHKFHQVEIPGSREPQLWNAIFKFLEKASTLKFDDREKQKRYEMISFAEINDAVTQLKELTDLLNAPVVFAHNDLLSGNLMLNDDEEKLYFIDFEYGSYSFRGYDIANHFNEYAGFDCDYSLYPDKDAQYHFFRHYLQPDRPHEVKDEDLKSLHVETNCYKLASHLYWALWALIQAKMSPINFDYLDYFFLRYKEYKKQKDSCFTLAKSFLTESGTG